MPTLCSSTVLWFTLAAVFLDTYSNFEWAYPLRNKAAESILDLWMELVAFIQARTQNTVKELQTDNGVGWGGGFVNALMANFNKSKGITHRTTAPYAHAMNGRVERLIRTLSNGTRTSLQAAESTALWLHSLSHMLRGRNRVIEPSTSASKSPYEVL
jgi:transposase InsO family protein